MTRILIVEDQVLVREYLKECAQKCENCQVVGELGQADAALMRCGKGDVDLILMDICTENDSDGITAAAAVKAKYPGIKILLVTSMIEGRFLQRAKEAKVDSFWYKDAPSEDLAVVISRTINGEHIFPDRCPVVRFGKIQSCDLTARQMDVLRLLCEGQTIGEIVAELGIGERTVRSYLDEMLQKTGYPNRNRLVVAAVSKKLVVPRGDDQLFREE